MFNLFIIYRETHFDHCPAVQRPSPNRVHTNGSEGVLGCAPWTTIGMLTNILAKEVQGTCENISFDIVLDLNNLP